MKKEQSHHSTTLLIAQAKYTNKRPYRKAEAVKLLELLLFDAKRKKYPSSGYLSCSGYVPGRFSKILPQYSQK